MICENCETEKIKFGAYTCKTCRFNYLLIWRKKNRKSLNLWSKNWVLKNKEKRKKIIKDYESKPEVKISRTNYLQGYRNKNRDKLNAYTREHRRLNPELTLASKNRRRARLASVPREAYKSKEIYQKFNFKCVYCGDKATCLDHVHPISRGGPDTIANLVAACRPCNTSKSNKLVTEWKRPLELRPG